MLMRIFTGALLCLGVAAPALTWAADLQWDTQPETRWKSILILGADFAGKTDYTLKTASNGAVVGTSSDRAGAGFLSAGEITYQSDFPLGGSFIVEGTRYEYKDATGGSDGEVGIYLMPRLAQRAGIVEVWAGVGVGLMITTVGGQLSGTYVYNGTPITLSVTNDTPVSFAWTPRIGVDFNIDPIFVVGLQATYTQTSPSIGLLATSGGTSVSFNDDATRSWFSAAVRLGTRF